MLSRPQIQQLAHLKKKLYNGRIWNTEGDESFNDNQMKYIKSHFPKIVAPVSMKTLSSELDWVMTDKRTATKVDAVVGSDWFSSLDFIERFKAAFESIKQHGYIALTLPIGLHKGEVSIQPSIIHRLVNLNEMGVTYFRINHASGQYPVTLEINDKDEFNYDKLIDSLRKYKDAKSLYMSFTLQKSHTGAFRWE